MSFVSLSKRTTALFFIFAVMLWLLKRRFNVSGASGPLRIRSVLAVGPRERIVLIDAENQSLIVGVTSNRISTLASWQRSDDANVDALTKTT